MGKCYSRDETGKRGTFLGNFFSCLSQGQSGPTFWLSEQQIWLSEITQMTDIYTVGELYRLVNSTQPFWDDTIFTS